MGDEPDARVCCFLDQRLAQRLQFGADFSPAENGFDALFFARRERQAAQVDGGSGLAPGKSFQRVANLVQQRRDVSRRCLDIDGYGIQ